MNAFRSASLLALTVSILLPTASYAENHEGSYVAGMAVLPFERDGEAKVSGQDNAEVEYMTGWGLSGSGGYAWGNGLRTEVELVYRNNDVNKIGPDTALADGGVIHNMALMGNVAFDYDLGKRLTPYVGFGVGGARVDADNIRYTGGSTSLNDDQYMFAYQAFAGFNFDLEGPWSFTADYRYFATPDVDLTASNGSHADLENSSHSIMMGIRYEFKKPAPAPALVIEPALAPVPDLAKLPNPPVPEMPAAVPPVAMPIPQSYIVFFDFDKANLTPEAKRIIASAAADYKDGKYVRVVVTAHTDTSGTRRYNMALSKRRAKAVREEFAALGVDSRTVTISAFGESKLMVPTTDGVREAQNRRAEIVLEK